MFLLVWLCGLWQKHKLRLIWSRFVVKSVVQFPSWQQRTFSSELLGLNIYSGTLRSSVFPMNSLVYTWVGQVLVTLQAVLSQLFLVIHHNSLHLAPNFLSPDSVTRNWLIIGLVYNFPIKNFGDGKWYCWFGVVGLSCDEVNDHRSGMIGGKTSGWIL